MSTLRDLLSHIVVNILAVSQQYSKIKQLLVELRDIFNAAFIKGAFSRFCVLSGSAKIS